MATVEQVERIIIHTVGPRVNTRPTGMKKSTGDRRKYSTASKTKIAAR